MSHPCGKLRVVLSLKAPPFLFLMPKINLEFTFNPLDLCLNY